MRRKHFGRSMLEHWSLVVMMVLVVLLLHRQNFEENSADVVLATNGEARLVGGAG